MSLQEEVKSLKARVAELEARVAEKDKQLSEAAAHIEWAKELFAEHDSIRAERAELAEVKQKRSDMGWSLAGQSIEAVEILEEENQRAQKGLKAGPALIAHRAAERFNEAERLRDLCVLEGRDYPEMLFDVEEGLQAWAAQGEGREAAKQETIRKYLGFSKAAFDALSAENGRKLVRKSR